MKRKISQNMESAMETAKIGTRPVMIKKYRQKIRHYILGTVENLRKQKRPKSPKRERPDSVRHLFSGYVHDATNFKNRKWHEEALLKEDGYTKSVWLENFPD